MLGPFSIDTYLPAFSNIATTLHTGPLQVQQTLTAYLLAFGVMILWHGSLSDAFGRRNVILVSLAVFAVASLGCAAAHSIEYLWAFRVLQGISAGAGAVVGRAIIRDAYEGPDAARLLSLVTMIFSIAPGIAPILGGWIVKLFSWRGIFLFLFAFTVILAWTCHKLLPETLPPEKRHPFHPRHLLASYKQVFHSAHFHLKAGTIAFNFAGMFLYIASAPAFVTVHLKLGQDQFGWQFIPQVGGIFLGALLVNRLAGRLSIPRQVAIGFVFLIGAGIANVGYHLFFPPAIPWSVIPLFFYTFGMSLVAPGATLMVLDLFPDIRGVVASCQSFTMTILGSVVAGVAAPILSQSVLWLAVGQLCCAAVALSLWVTARSYKRELPATVEENAWEALEELE